MGMFDWYKVDDEIMVGPHRATDGMYQGKDLDNCMYTYRITADRRLLRETVTYEAVPEEELPPKPEKEDGMVAHLFWLNSHRREIARDWEEIPYHGMLYFYDYESETRTSHDYTAKFTDGRLVSMVYSVEILPTAPPREA